MPDGKLRVKENKFCIQYDEMQDKNEGSESEDDMGQREDERVVGVGRKSSRKLSTDERGHVSSRTREILPVDG